MTVADIAVVAALAAAAMGLALPPSPAPRPPFPARPSAARGAPPARVGVAPAATSRALALLAALATGGGVALLVGGWLGLALGLVGAVVVRRVLDRMEPAAVRRRRERLVRDLPHAVDLMAAALAVGASPGGAVEQVVSAVDPPVRDELALVAQRLSYGVDPATVWGDVARHPELGALGRCVLRATHTGASVADAMHRLSDDQRRTARAAVEMRARAVGVKAAAPLGLCLLPAFILTGVVPLVAGSVGMLLGR